MLGQLKKAEAVYVWLGCLVRGHWAKGCLRSEPVWSTGGG